MTYQIDLVGLSGQVLCNRCSIHTCWTTGVTLVVQTVSHSLVGRGRTAAMSLLDEAREVWGYTSAISTYSRCDCVKSLWSSYTGLHPQRKGQQDAEAEFPADKKEEQLDIFKLKAKAEIWP